MHINRVPYRHQSMNLVHKTADGTELWLGDYYAATNLPLLRQKGIKSVLTSAAMLGINYPKQQQISHKTINAFDLPSYRMTPHFQEAFEFINSSLKRGNILVHCAAGISRSTTFVLVYLMRAEGMNFKQGMDYVRAKRSIICPNEGFQKELKRYQTTLKKILPTIEKQKPEVPEENVEKKVVLEFLQQDKKDPRVTGMLVNGQANKTFNNVNPITNNYVGLFRGKSLNYSKRPNNVGPDNSLKETKQQAKDASDTRNKDMKSVNTKAEQNRDPKQTKQAIKQPKQVAKLTQQFLTFKLQTPKIVTIKK